MDIEGVLKDTRVEFLTSGHHHCRPGWIQLDCPYCGSGSRRFHLGFALSSRSFNCWKCGPHKTYETLVKLGVKPALCYQFVKSTGPLPESAPSRDRTRLVEPKYRGPLAEAHRAYLRDRGFDPDKLERLWQLEGIGLATRLAWRIYIPIIRGGERVSWTTRTIGDSGQRYLSASFEEESVNHKDVVYGRDFCRGSVVVVEGPADAWAVGPGAGALFGIAFSVAQVKALAEIPRRYVCFDSAPDAQRRAEDLCSQLCLFPGVTENLVLDAKDPGEASKHELDLVRRVAGI